MTATMRLTAMVVFILLGARVSSASCSRASAVATGSKACSSSLPGGVVGFLLFVNAFVFVMAFFLDFFEIAFIIIPLLAADRERRSASTWSGSG